MNRYFYSSNYRKKQKIEQNTLAKSKVKIAYIKIKDLLRFLCFLSLNLVIFIKNSIKRLYKLY